MQLVQMGFRRRRGDDDPPTTFDDQLPFSRLILRFAATGLVALMVVAVVSAYVSRQIGTQEAIEDADRVAAIAAQSTIEPILTDGLLMNDPEALRRVDWAVRFQVLRGSLVRVKIWAADGTILYSDESRLIGQRFDLGDDEIAVLDGGPAYAHLSDLDEPENQYEEPAVELLEAYQLIRTPEGEPLLFEAYFQFEGVETAGRQVWLRFAPVLLGALLLLELLQLPLALSLARRLRRTQGQRELLYRQAIESTDHERRRIASDLHDGVVQDLVGVALSLSAVARSTDNETTPEVRESADRIRDSVRSLRSLLVEIYPPNLSDEGLESALTDLVAKVEPRGVSASLVIEAPLEALNTDTTQLVYRAAQEGLRNVISHSGASKVDVSLRRDNGSILLSICDDGTGISHGAEVQEGHMGLKALAGLAETMGGSVTVDSADGDGTTMTLEVPVR